MSLLAERTQVLSDQEFLCNCPPKTEDIYSNGLFGIPASGMPIRTLIVGIDHTQECWEAQRASHSSASLV